MSHGRVLVTAGVMLLSSIAPASAGAPLTASGGQWGLVWQDEFDAPRIDPDKWELEVNCWGGGNAEQQCYTDRRDDAPQANAYVADGLLHIVARKERFSAPASPDDASAAHATLPYTSARLRTRGRQAWTFGRFEIRAKLPRGQGSWPAIWMLPSDGRYGAWAASGEIDIMEAVNLGTASDDPDAPGTVETRVHGTLHYGGRSPGNVHAGTSYRLPGGANPADDFHVYALEWEQGQMRWYVDGVHYATQSAEHWYSQPGADAAQPTPEAGAPFDASARFHLLLNLAVGGNWAGKVNAGGIDESAFPQTLLVDYVRVYQCLPARADGLGCATIGADAVLVKPEQGGQFPQP